MKTTNKTKLTCQMLYDDIFEEEISEETFIHYEDTKAICIKCKGTKELIKGENNTYNFKPSYWKYKNTQKDCNHDWRKADYDSTNSKR